MGALYLASLHLKTPMRLFRGAPAPTNLEVPPYTFVSDGTLVIGEDPEKKGA